MFGYGVILLVAIACLFLFRRLKEVSKNYKQSGEEQVFRLFVPGKRMTAIDVSRRLQEATGGRENLSISLLYDYLDSLVAQGKLEKEATAIGHEYLLEKVEYFLPESKQP